MITLDTFIGISAALTGASREVLRSRKEQRQLAETYFNVLREHVPPSRVKALFKAFVRIEAETGEDGKAILVTERILSDEMLGPVAKSIIRMWQLGVWCNDVHQQNNLVLSATAYRNGMVWGTMGAHPIGYNSDDARYWSVLPVIPPIL